MDYKYQDIGEYELNGNLVGTVMYKPTVPIYVVFVIGVALMFLNMIAARLLAAFMIVTALFVFFKVKDKKCIDVYDDCLLIYDANGEKCTQIYLDDIAEYNINLNEKYMIFIRLNDGRSMRKESMRMDLADKYLKQVLKGKSTMEIRQEENKNTEFRPMRSLHKLMKRLAKKN